MGGMGGWGLWSSLNNRHNVVIIVRPPLVLIMSGSCLKDFYTLRAIIRTQGTFKLCSNMKGLNPDGGIIGSAPLCMMA